MDCATAHDCLSARLDGENPPELEAAVAAHIESCADCRAWARDLAAVDTLLRDQFAGDPAADRVARGALTLARPTARPAPHHDSSRHSSRLIAALIAASALAICLMVLTRPEGRRRDPVAGPDQMLITLARGTVNIQPPATETWRTISLPTDAIQPIGSRLRTEEASQCEFRCPTGSIVRLDERCDLTVSTPDELSIAAGRIWCCAKAPSSLTVVTALATERKPLLVFSCPSEKAMQADVTPQETARVVAARGPIQVERGATLVRLETDEWVSCSPAGISEPTPIDGRQETEWMLPLLAMRGGRDPEFAGEVTSLLARLGNTKASYIRQEQLINLGAPAAIPLIAYLKESVNSMDAFHRTAAANVIRETAALETAPDLVSLLEDSQADVRMASASALQRLTSLDHGMPPPEWRELGAPQHEAAARWRAWLKQR